MRMRIESYSTRCVCPSHGSLLELMFVLKTLSRTQQVCGKNICGVFSETRALQRSSGLVSGPQTFPLRRGKGLSDRLGSCCTGRNADYKCCFHNTHFADVPFPAITGRMRVEQTLQLQRATASYSELQRAPASSLHS